jgi:hypothetical protein
MQKELLDLQKSSERQIIVGLETCLSGHTYPLESIYHDLIKSYLHTQNDRLKHG